MATGPSEPGVISPRARRRESVVGVIERDSAAVCEVIVENGLKLRRAAIERNGAGGLKWSSDDPAAIADTLASLLHRARLPLRLDALALPQSWFGTSCTSIPAAQGDALRALLADRLRLAATDSKAAYGEWLVDSTPIGNPGDETAESTPVVLAWTDRAAMDRLNGALLAKRVDVQRIVPPAVGLLSLLGHATRGTKGAQLVVHASLPSVCALLFDGETLLDVRPLREATAASAAELADVVAREAQGLAAAFQDKLGGRKIEQAFVSGLERAQALRVCVAIAKSTGGRGAPLAVLRDDPRTTPVDENLLGPHLPLLAGLALPVVRPHLTRAPPLSLLPRPPRKPMFVTTAAAAAIFLIAALWTRASWSDEAERRRRLADSLGIDLARLETSQESRERSFTEARRHAAEKQSLALVAPAGSDPLQPVLEAITLVPDGLDLVAARLTRPPADPTATGSQERTERLELEVGGDPARSSPELVAQLVRRLEERPWCARAAARDPLRVEVELR